MPASFTRNNAWANGGTLAGNADLLWYTIGVGKMMQRSITDPTSWWYFAAIHGDGPEWAGITAPPQVPPLPSPELRGWSQCQHATWYFPPWHRGYLIALEIRFARTLFLSAGPPPGRCPIGIISGSKSGGSIQYTAGVFGEDFPAGGQPATWRTGEYCGIADPLFVDAGYGPNGDGVIFVPTQAGITAHPQDPNSDFAFRVVTAN